MLGVDKDWWCNELCGGNGERKVEKVVVRIIIWKMVFVIVRWILFIFFFFLLFKKVG